jgi:hypothetical protein
MMDDRHAQGPPDGGLPRSASPSRRGRQDPTVQIRTVQGTSGAWIALVTAAGIAGVVVFGLGLYMFLARRNAVSADPFPISSNRAPSFLDDRANAATPDASASDSTPIGAGATDAGASPSPFDRDAARATLDALGPKLSDCKVPHGRSVKVKVTFSSDGHVSAASVLPPSSGRQSSCVAARLREVHVAPFDGASATTTQTLIAR